MITPPLDLPALREIAKAATPGPWAIHNAGDEVFDSDNHAGWWWVWQESKLPYYGGVASTAECDEPGQVCETAITGNLDGHQEKADARHIAAFDPPTVLALLDRLEAAERDLAAVTVSRDGWQTRAETAEKAVARVEALCQDTDGNWLNPEDECNNVGSILQAVRGEHTKQLGGTPTGEFADVCSCGKSYWPCDSLDGGA